MAGPSREMKELRLGGLIGAALAALLLVALRVNTIDLRYRLGDARQREPELAERKRELTVALRRLRDPLHLTRSARKLGFAPPERVLVLPSRSPGEDPSQP